MEELHKHSTSNNSILKIIATVLFITLPFIGFILGMQYQAIIDSSESQSEIAAPSPIKTKVSPSVNQTEVDTQVTLPNSRHRITIPKGAKYQITDQGYSIGIELTKNVTVSMCAGCQMISLFKKCGPSYGMTGEGNCTQKDTTLAGIKFEAHSSKNNPEGLEFISGSNKGLSISIQTADKKMITDNERVQLDKLISSITSY